MYDEQALGKRKTNSTVMYSLFDLGQRPEETPSIINIIFRV